ncbi:hypothetical protein [Streptomyces sp. NPDC000229]|uniref:hypothetical protein n=1 Tax=Streptomyces sp. NPDC000229 TaxID=3154247 RepID=UPI00331F1AC2
MDRLKCASRNTPLVLTAPEALTSGQTLRPHVQGIGLAAEGGGGSSPLDASSPVVGTL